ncbi:dedicator of cytokinesis protein 7 isoform X2 [Hyalella azteca]|uniref:Dedicator of cytokinesis protein 7 isoform X2 n=1 Tax=Hyalella azteca TaxID=294128 RepID=A0A979FMM2_HYAAZ|nr:dedicator of cytokinesis protein 7 isoform X2 [Hyalella azteca]
MSSSISQRAFAQRLSRQHAADVRKTVSAATQGQEPPAPNRSPSNSTIASQLSLVESIDSVDYEEFLERHQSELERDPDISVLCFPPDDVTVSTFAWPCRTLQPLLPLPSEVLDAHVGECVRCYSKDFIHVTRRYLQYSSSYAGRTGSMQGNFCAELLERVSSLPLPEYEADQAMDDADNYKLPESMCSSRHSTISVGSSVVSAPPTGPATVVGSECNTPRGSWASSVFDLRNSQGDPLLPSLLQPTPPHQTDALNEKARAANRHDSLLLLYPEQEEEDLIERRVFPPPPTPHSGHRIQVKCIKLQLELEIEPVFATLALYDLREKKKISENFCFDMNPDPLKKMLTSHIPYQDISTLSRTCILEISYPSPDVFLVVRLEKVLQGDIADCLAPYAKDDSHRDKLKAAAVSCCERLGRYRQPLAWTAINLMNIFSGAHGTDGGDAAAAAGAGAASTSLPGALERKGSVSTGSLTGAEESTITVTTTASGGGSGSNSGSMKRKQQQGPATASIADGLATLQSGSLPRRGSMERRSFQEKSRSWSTAEFASCLDSFRPVTLTVSSFFKQEGDKLRDEDLYKFLADLKRPSSQLKKKCLPGRLKLDISPVTHTPKYCLTPELARVNPYPGGPEVITEEDEKCRPVKEVLEFPPTDVLSPHYNYRNLLYIYPKDLNFTNRPGSARNLAVKVQVMEGEDESAALACVMGRSSCPELSTEAFTAVTYHTKSPDYYDEIKVKLPAVLGDQHHLLFTFYHVSCQRKADEKTIETPVGYTWLPIYRNGSLSCGSHCLPVMSEKPPANYSYITPHILLPGTKWVDNHKGIFNVVLHAVSTVHPQCPELDHFFDLIKMVEERNIPARIGEEKIEAEIKKALVELVQSSGRALVQFLPVLFDRLLVLLVRPPLLQGLQAPLQLAAASFNAIVACVAAIVNVLENKNDQHGRNSVLLTYIAYLATIPHPTDPPPPIQHPGGPKRPHPSVVQPPAAPTSPTHSTASGGSAASSTGAPGGTSQASMASSASSSTSSSGYVGPVISESPVGITASLGGDDALHGACASSGSIHSLHPSAGGVAMQPSHRRSTSNPDLGVEADAGAFFSRGLDRTNSMRTEEGGAAPRSGPGSSSTYEQLSLAVSGPCPAGGCRLVHEELVLQWVFAGPATRDLALNNAWFLFELMIKSMCEHLARSSITPATPRRQRFSQQFSSDLSKLVTSVTNDIIAAVCRDDDITFTTRLNCSLAFFLSDLFSVMDRGHVLRLVRGYVKEISSRIATIADPSHLMNFKLDFLRILCSHEHYVALNLPFCTPLSGPSAPSSPCPSVSSGSSQCSLTSTVACGGSLTDYTSLTPTYRRHHFLSGLLLHHLHHALSLNSPSVHGGAINALRTVLTAHDTDDRYARHAGLRARVAALYLPLLDVLVDALPQLTAPSPAGGVSWSNSSSEDDASSGLQSTVARAIAGPSVCREPDVDISHQAQRLPLSSSNTRHLLVSLLWLLRNADAATLRQVLAGLPYRRLHGLLHLLYIALTSFQYQGRCGGLGGGGERSKADMRSRLEEAIMGQNSARTEMIRRRDRHPASGGGQGAGGHGSDTPHSGQEKLRWRKETFLWRNNPNTHHHHPFTHHHHAGAGTTLSTGATLPPGDGSAPSTPVPLFHQLSVTGGGGDGGGSGGGTSGSIGGGQDNIFGFNSLELHLAAEATLIVLDTLELIVQVVSSSEALHSLLGVVLKVLLHSLSLPQCTQALTNIFNSQRALVAKFPSLLFDEETEQCADLCLQLLRHCSSGLTPVRAHAAASLYALMRHNFIIGNNFSRVKMQVTMSLSSLVGTWHSFSESCLRASLKTILTYSEQDTHLPHSSSFPEQVKELMFNLHMILSDTVKMKEYQEDPEMLLDLMYRIARGYQNSPDLRLTWLANMAQKHSEREQHAEAAMCLVHSAALVSEYLYMLEDRPHLPVGATSFHAISPNVLQESAVSEDVVSPDEEGICTGKYFTESGLVGLLEQASSSFLQAGMFECINLVYKILTPIAEENRDWKKLINIHSKLLDAYTRMDQLEGKRIFGTYFRVGFYGAKFGDLDGEEFIYKEPTLTKLAEISHRLESFYCDRFGEENFSIIKDSNSVDVTRLDPDKAYVQITYVEPHFDDYEFKNRRTSFERNYNINRFIFSTPFTPDGRAHGDLREQHKRKTILTTQHMFPYVKTRVQVVDRESCVVTPIEVAIEDIQKKTRELAAAIYQEPPDHKILQMVLQGCIGTTVNQGPMEVAHVFLSDLLLSDATPTIHQNKLRLCFKDFSKKCHDALRRNKLLIGPDMREYQRELERNYHSFTEKLRPMITVNHLQRATPLSSPTIARHSPWGGSTASLDTLTSQHSSRRSSTSSVSSVVSSRRSSRASTLSLSIFPR